MKVLSVDDSAIIRKIIRGAIDTLGFEFVEAENGTEALHVLADNLGEVDLIILDWNMPVKDGISTLKELKADTRFAHIPVMMVTTEAERSNIVMAIQAGAKQYLTKPFTQEDLMIKIMECLGMGAF